MKLYFTPGSGSLSPHIVAREAGIDIDLIKVNLATKKASDGTDLTAVNPKGQVPVLQLDNGAILTEGVAIIQYLADQAPARQLAPAAGTLERYRLQEWLNFIASEVHKGCYFLMFSRTAPEGSKDWARANLFAKFDELDGTLAGPYLMGDNFTVADAYFFTTLTWSGWQKIDLGRWPNLAAYKDRVGGRPSVIEAMTAEGLLK